MSRRRLFPITFAIRTDDQHNRTLEVRGDAGNVVNDVKTLLNAGAVDTAALNAAISAQHTVDNGTYGQVVALIGTGIDLTGTTDSTAALNVLLASAAGKVARGVPGSTYRIDSALVVYSGTTLDMTGCTITGPSADNFLKNAAALPARTVTDATTTAASTTVGSATAAFTSADVGKAVGVLSAGPNALGAAPGTFYGTVVSQTGTAAVLSSSAQLTTSGSTLYVFPARDSNIAVIGGTWNGKNKDAIYQTLPGHGFLFRRVDGLTIRNVTLTSTGTASLGGRYAISLGDVTNVSASDLTFATGGDGIHTAGPAQRVSIRNVYGTTGDDMVAFTTVDGASQAGSLLGDVEGDISTVTVSDIHANAAYRGLKVTAGTGTNNASRTISGFVASRIVGTTVQEPVAVINYAGSGKFDGDISSVHAYSTTAGTASVWLATSFSRTVRLRDIQWTNAALAPTAGIIKLTANVNSLVVDGLILRGNATGTGKGIAFNGGAPNALILRGVVAMEAPPTFHAVSFASSSLTVKSIAVSQVHTTAVVGNVVNVESGGGSANITDIQVSDGYLAAGAVYQAAADSTNALKIRIANWRQLAGALVITRSPTTVYLEGVEVAATSAAVQADSTGATAVRVVGTAAVTSGSLLSRTASQSLSANGHALPVDQSILTPTDGDIINNTNATPLNGTGVAIYNTAATKWKNLYSGTTS